MTPSLGDAESHLDVFAIFFTLSGFLITRFLLPEPEL